MSNKNTLHLVWGAFGGVGASWFAKLLIETYRSLNLEHYVVDTDESALDIDRAYNPDYYDPIKVAKYREYVKMMKKENETFVARKQINFIFERIEDQLLPNEILDLTIEKDTIANIPCKVNKVFNQWIQKECLGIAIDDLRTVCWFVTIPTRRSIQELKKLYNYHNGHLKIILVKNNLSGYDDAWNLALDEETKKFLECADIPQIEIGNLKLMSSLYEQNKLLNDDYPALFELLDPEDERLTDDQKEQFSTYLRMATDAIVGTGLLSSCELEAKI